MDRNKRQEENSPFPLAKCSRAIRTGTNGAWELIEGGRKGGARCLSIGYQWTHPAIAPCEHSGAPHDKTSHSVCKHQAAPSSSGLPCTPRGETHLISSTFSATSMHMDERKRCHHESRYVARHRPPQKRKERKRKRKKKNHDPLLL